MYIYWAKLHVIFSFNYANVENKLVNYNFILCLNYVLEISSIFQ